MNHDPHPSPHESGWRLGVDIGGTFTDVILLGPTGELHTVKVLSTPPTFEQGVITALEAACTEAGLAPSALSTLLHGTTVATNAILEEAGARTGLLTTSGFKDVLELGRLRRPALYDLQWVKPEPLAARHLRLELDQRIAADGRVLTPIDPSQVERAVARLLDEEVEAVAVCLINSHANPDEERRVADMIRTLAPSLYVTASVDVSPEMYEFERTSTAVVNSYVGPVVHDYVSQLVEKCRDRGVGADLMIMQSTGGLLEADVVVRQPVQIIESGPAAGVIAVQNLSRALGFENVVAFDMGGTTAKASLLESGEPFIAADYEVGGGMNVARGLGKGAGYAIRFPSIDIAEVGAGGGSIIHTDPEGALHVGPQSAQAFPGPACYGRGGDRATLTDANVVLGYLSPAGLAGGRVEISADLAEKVLTETGASFGMGALHAARGAYQVAVSNMTQAVKAVTSERGRDPRESVLVAFGGAGPLYGAYLAEALGISTVVVPPHPGLFSSVGLLTADIERQRVQPFGEHHQDLGTLTSEIGDMEKALADELAVHHTDLAGMEISRYLDMRYQGQRFDLRVALSEGPITATSLAAARSDFHAEHKRTYGRSGPDELVQIVNVRVVARIPGPVQIQSVMAPSVSTTNSATTTRSCWFDEHVETPVVSRAAVRGEAMPGPVIVEDMDSTVLVPPGATYRRDAMSNIIIEWPAPAAEPAEGAIA